jgi:hypothetical protein
MEEDPMDRPQAAEWLYAAEDAKRRARRARRAFWVPLVIFGALTLLATPLYRFPSAPHGGGPTGMVIARPLGPLGWFAGGFFLRTPWLVSLFWLVALPVGYGLTVLYYHHRAHRRGVAGSVRPYVLTGIGLLAFLVVASAVGRLQPGDLFIRGLTPLLTIALGLLVLAWAERSSPLAIFAIAFLALTLLVDLYDIENLFYRLGVSVPLPAISLIVPGSILVLAGAGFWVASGRRQ